MDQTTHGSAAFEEIAGNFELLEDWEDRYRYLIDLGNQLEPLSDSEHVPVNKVHGCASQVWLVTEASGRTDPVLRFRGDSDAHIVRGLIAVLLAIFSGKPSSEIVSTNEKALLDRLRLTEHISAQRSNGLRSMVARIKQIAREAAGAHSESAIVGR
jgi:cysteine desulfuration protein SufE